MKTIVSATAPIITLTTDFGTRDGFVGQMKGVILSISPQVRLVDVTHDIEPYRMDEAALVIKGVAGSFPQGTIHVVVVDPGVGGARRPIAVLAGGQRFAGPDNGVFTHILTENKGWEAYEIRNPEFLLSEPHPTFHGRDVFAPAAAHFASGRSLGEAGPRIHDPVLLPRPKVEHTSSGLQGEVVYIDRFGNASSNIQADMLDRPVASVTVGNADIRGIRKFFAEASEGEVVALINSFGLLEIAVNQGHAGRQLGIDKGAKVVVTWSAGRSETTG